MRDDAGISTRPAAEFLEVALIKHWHAWLVAIVSFLPILIRAAIAQERGSDLELLHPCRVVIRRSSDRGELVRFRYFRLNPAAQHCDDIAQKIGSETVKAICLRYDIALNDVS